MSNVENVVERARAALAEEMIEEQDYVKVVRCVNCKHLVDMLNKRQWCEMIPDIITEPERFFCADGERKAGE